MFWLVLQQNVDQVRRAVLTIIAALRKPTLMLCCSGYSYEYKGILVASLGMQHSPVSYVLNTVVTGRATDRYFV